MDALASLTPHEHLLVDT